MQDAIEVRKYIDELEQERINVGNALWLLEGRVRESLEAAQLFDAGSTESQRHIAAAAAVNAAIELVRDSINREGTRNPALLTVNSAEQAEAHHRQLAELYVGRLRRAFYELRPIWARRIRWASWIVCGFVAAMIVALAADAIW